MPHVTGHETRDQCRDLPLFYVWNERQQPQGLSYTVSVNAWFVDQLMDLLVDSDLPAWQEIRKEVVKLLNELVTQSVEHTIIKTNYPPSIIFVSHDDIDFRERNSQSIASIFHSIGDAVT